MTQEAQTQEVKIRARPLHDRIVVKRDTPETMTEGGIYLPHKARNPTRSGEVLAVGPGVIGPSGELIVPACKIGDMVIFGEYAGTEVQIDGENLQVMRDGDVVVVVDPAANIKTAVMEQKRHNAHAHYLDG
jgi:chaperonin GroES